MEDKKIPANKLIVGTRYWLDSAKDLSAVFVGRDGNDFCFKNPDFTGRYIECIDDKFGESIPFGAGSYFYEMDETHPLK